MRSWSALLACLTLAAGLWLVMELTRVHSNLESVRVVALSRLDGYSYRSTDVATITARCSAKGFDLLTISDSQKPREVFFEAEDFVQTSPGTFKILAPSLYKYVKNIYGNGVDVESFVTSDVSFHFSEENCRKVPVVPYFLISCKPQYMVYGDISLSPDSVMVYGTPERIAGIGEVYTKSLSRTGLGKSIHGVQPLEVPAGTRLSHNDVTFSLNVVRYVQLTRSVPVKMINVPDGVTVSSFPKSVAVSLKCTFPFGMDPFGLMEFHIDYREFSRSLSGKCRVVATNVPDSVISWEADPPYCKCIEKI